MDGEEQEPLALSVRTNSFTMAISREQAIDYGMVQATPEEIAARNERLARFHEEARALRAAWQPILRALYEDTRGLAKVVLDLHAPEFPEHTRATCKGCPPDNEYGQPDWPCDTVRAVAEWCRVDLPGEHIPSARYDEEFVPWDGTPFCLPRLESFVTLDPDDIGGAAE